MVLRETSPDRLPAAAPAAPPTQPRVPRPRSAGAALSVGTAAAVVPKEGTYSAFGRTLERPHSPPRAPAIAPERRALPQMSAEEAQRLAARRAEQARRREEQERQEREERRRREEEAYKQEVSGLGMREVCHWLTWQLAPNRTSLPLRPSPGDQAAAACGQGRDRGPAAPRGGA